MTSERSPIIVAAPPAYGETTPLIQLGALLQRRGHRVTALVGESFVDLAASAGLEVVAVPGSTDVARLVSDPQRLALPPGPAQLNWDHTHVFVGGIAAQHDALQELLRAAPETVLVSNALFFGAWPVAAGAPGRRPRRWIAVGANPVVAADDRTTAFGPLPDTAGGDGRAAHRRANAEFEAMFEPTSRAAQEAVDALGATRALPPYVAAWYELPDAFVALTVPEFDFPRTTPPPTLRYGGILPLESPADATVPTWLDDLDPGRPVVVVTQGTAANHDFGDLVRPTLEALADRDVQVVAALGRDTAALGVEPPANARVEEFVPFDVLLPRADVLVTNGGFGGTQLALAHGVPVVVAGTTEDKPMVAARVAFHGVGVDLGTDRPGASQIGDAVASVLENASYRTAAQRLVPAYAGVDAVSTVAQLLT